MRSKNESLIGWHTETLAALHLQRGWIQLLLRELQAELHDTQQIVGNDRLSRIVHRVRAVTAKVDAARANAQFTFNLPACRRKLGVNQL